MVRHWGSAALALVLFSTVAACGDDDSDESGSSTPPSAVVTEGSASPASSAASGESPTEPDRLVFSAAGTNPNLVGTVGLGVAAGVFADLGLDVVVEVTGRGEALNAVIAGRADITEMNTTSAMDVEGQGKDMSAIWAASGGGAGWALVTSSTGPASVDELVALAQDGCTVAVTAPGSTGYGFTKMFMGALGIDCELIEHGEVDLMVGALLADRVDAYAAPLNEPQTAAALEAGRAQVILNTSDPSIAEFGLPRFTQRVFVGLAENLDDKRDAVSRFVAGLKTAADMFQSMGADEIAAALLTVDAIAVEYPTAADEERLAAGVELAKEVVDWNHGYISPEDWELGLETMATWDIPEFDPTDDARSYERIVDMSFFEAST